MADDVFRLLRKAVVKTVNADATLRTLMGRIPSGNPPSPATALITTWRSLKLDGPLPIIAYQLLAFPQTGGDNDTRRGRLRFTVFAQAGNALQSVEDVAARLETLITASALIAEGVDGAPILTTRLYLDPDSGGDDGTQPEPTRSLERADVEMDLEMVQAA